VKPGSSVIIHPYYFSGAKRMLDVSVALVGLIIGSPFLIAIGTIVWLTAGSPIIFTQSRAGKFRTAFTVFKFRTMTVGADNHQSQLKKVNQAPLPFFKVEHDPRFTGMGYWLSKSGIDELPQLINILLGEMSLVGPRPLPIHEANRLSSDWEFRFQVKPGIFSDWAKSNSKHESLTAWMKLEKNGLKTGGIFSDLYLTISTCWLQFRRIFNT